MRALQQLRDAFAIVPNQWRAPIRDWLSNRRFFRNLLVNGKDLDLIETELRALDRTPWERFRSSGATVGTTERVVEIPWVASRFQREQRVLDVGSSHAISPYLVYLAGLGIAELHGVDLSPRSIKGMIMTTADVRNMPYPDGKFELILCVSTLEHIGRDNAKYEIGTGAETNGDREALLEMGRVLDPQGRILITVPFGQLEHHGWFKQYDWDAWNALLEHTKLHATEMALYGYSPATGWRAASDPAELHSKRYQDMGAPGATGLLCAELVHR
jgi:O-antigen chain-terminating methyltransferase